MHELHFLLLLIRHSLSNLVCNLVFVLKLYVLRLPRVLRITDLFALQIFILVSEDRVVPLLPERQPTINVMLQSSNTARLRRQLIAEKLEVEQILKVAEVIDLHHCEVTLQVVSFLEINQSQPILRGVVGFSNIDCSKFGQPTLHQIDVLVLEKRWLLNFVYISQWIVDIVSVKPLLVDMEKL